MNIEKPYYEKYNSITSCIDRISSAFAKGQSPDDLSELDQEVFTSISTADDLIRRYGITKSRKLLMERLKCTTTVAQKYIDGAQICFGSRSFYQKEYWASFSIDALARAMGYIVRQIELAEEFQEAQMKFRENPEKNPLPQEVNVSVSELSSLARLAKELREIVGFGKDETDAQKWEGVEQHIVMFTGNVREIGLKPIPNRDELVRKYLSDIAEDAEFSQE